MAIQRRGRTVSSDSFVGRINDTLDQRRAVYAHPQEQFQIQADMLNAFFGPRRGDFKFTAEDVSMIQVIVKQSRLASGTHDDSLLDMVGYLECIADLSPEQRNVRTTQ